MGKTMIVVTVISCASMKRRLPWGSREVKPVERV